MIGIPKQDEVLCNVAKRLTDFARRMPDRVAVAMPRSGKQRPYRIITFSQLELLSNLVAHGLQQWGVPAGSRLVVLLPPTPAFIAVVFGCLKAGVVSVLIDPGMGKRNLVRCLADVEPDGFIAVPIAHVVRLLFRRRFPKARYLVTLGPRLGWGGKSLEQLCGYELAMPVPTATWSDTPAAIIFTTGSTGPPKGVLYRHGNFDRQVTEIRDQYQIQPGEIDLPGFPLFGLFNAAMGVTTIIPRMDPSRPATVNPAEIVKAVQHWNVTQAFGSPAIWNRVGPYCKQHGVKLPTLKRVLSAGAPVPPHVLANMQAVIADDGEVHTPYGATEALPVATIGSREVLGETQFASRKGAGTCVGRRFPSIEWKVLRIVDGPIPTMAEAQQLPQGEIGELAVSGPVVTGRYVTRTEWNALAKIADGSRFWHRMGDAGYLDAQDRFWFCGRVAHRVVTAERTMYSVPCEAIYNEHPAIFRSALVGIGKRGQQRPVMICEPKKGFMPYSAAGALSLMAELRELGKQSDLTRSIDTVLLHPSMPVDIRHNAKIFREKLAVWAANRLRWTKG